MLLEVKAILLAIKRRNVLLYRVCEKVDKIAQTKDERKKAQLEGERSEFRQKSIEVTSNMHPQIKSAMKRVESAIQNMVMDYAKLNCNISLKKKTSITVNNSRY